MQEQQFYHNREINTDPREQTGETFHVESDGGKLRPAPPRGRKTAGIVLALIVLVGLISAAVFTTGQYTMQRNVLSTRTFALTGHSKLVIKNGSGHVYIHKGSGNSVTVQPTLFAFGLGTGVDPSRLSMSQDDSTVKIEDNEIGWSLFGNQGVDLDVTVPDAIDLDIQDGSGDVQVADVNGNVELKTGSGNMTANNLSGDITLKTGSGDIQVTNLNGQLEMETGSGSIKGNQVTLSKEGKIETGSGDIRLDGSLSPDASYRLQSGSGNIDLTLPTDSNFQLAVDSGSGSIHNSFGNNSAANSSLSIHTGSGDINIRKH